MSYTYTLALTTALSVDEMLRLICRHLDFEYHPTCAIGPAAKVHVRVSDKEDNENGLLKLDNAVLHAHDYLWLRFQNNALLLNSNETLWQEFPDLLSLITLSYETVPLLDD